MAVTLTDAAGIQNPLNLLYVSSTQIDGQIPAAAAIGAATFAVSPSTKCPAFPTTATQTGISQKGSVTLAAVAPGLYTANGTGKGTALGYVYDLVTGQTDNWLFSCTAAVGTPPVAPCSPVSIDVTQGAPALVLYGTGIRNRPSLSSVTVSIGSQTLSAFYAGVASISPEFDQVNVVLPSTLAGSGTVLVTVSISGAAAASNPVAINIQ
jgi:uncharacterized protein (TIGR03437 family)